MTLFFEQLPVRLAGVAVLLLANGLASTDARSSNARASLNASVTIHSDCMVRAAVVDWTTGMQLEQREQSSSRDTGVMITTCDAGGTPPITLKSIASDGIVRPLEVEVRTVVGSNSGTAIQVMPIGTAQAVLIHRLRHVNVPGTVPTRSEMVQATVSF